MDAAWTEDAVRDDPVFVFSTHRSGSTFLARVLNAHPNLVLWGEQAGLLNKLFDLDSVAGQFWNMTKPVPERNLPAVARKEVPPETFDPWTNPFDLESYRGWCRAFVGRTCQQSLPPERRWGLKEIRYHGPNLARFLVTLFPRCQFVVLRRDLVQLCLINILAPWSLDHLREMGAGMTEQSADAIIADVAYALTAIDRKLRRTQDAFADRCYGVWYRDILDRAPDMFAFLGLGVDEAVRDRVGRVGAAKAGATDRSSRLGMLDTAFIEARTPEMLRRAETEIERDGLDIGRLAHRKQDRFCFLVGDHENRRTAFTSFSWGG